MQEIDIINSVATSKIGFHLNTTLWENFDSNVMKTISESQAWSEIKLLDQDGKRNSQLSAIPNDQGGVYLIIAKSNILPDSHLYLMYIGRAHISSSQNLRKRCAQYPAEKKRPLIKRLIEQWGRYLYIRYLPLCDNTTIDAIETELISKILPPFNDRNPNKKISAAVKAFRV